MKRYMIADNSDIVRKVVSRILTKDGTVVHEAQNGSEAIEQCSFDMPDVVIVSSTLGDVSSDAVIGEIRDMAKAQQRFPTILACMMEMNVAEIMRAKRAGADGYILKPFTRPILLDALALYDDKAAAA